MTSIAPEVFAYAMKLASASGRFNGTLWANILLWPRVTRGAPDYWLKYCERWEILHALPKGLSGVAAAGVLHVITSAMSEHELIFDCFMRLATIANRAHVSERTVSRVLGWQRDAPAPLIAIRQGGPTRGIDHACHSFTLVINPPAFAAKRDAERARKVEDARARLAAFWPDMIADQQQLLREQISETEYDGREKRRHASARGSLPRRIDFASAGRVRR